MTRLDKSPKWLADEAGVSYETVRKWLADEIAPKRARVAAVAQILELSEEALMFGAERASAPAAGTQRTVASPLKASWPFSVPREEFDRIGPAEKANLDAVVTKFIAGCLAEQPVSARKNKVIEFTGHPLSTTAKKRGTK
ncbi:transcriptional regulator [Cupriavidus necator]|uniref:Transcriptional regulator n=1 Tax=Cupriavidus necator TaxID=106590 RepID=A0A367PAJ1_CUPNE|nr:transcriptional regulator [Cupriavidus necator]